MTQEPDKSLSETTIVEKAALELVKSDMNTAEKAPQPLPDIRKPAPVKADNRAVRERKARQASREMYADKTVPRIRSERRYGGSSHSRAYLKQALCLYSDRAQIFFENNYERVNMSLIVSTLVIEAIGGTKLAEEISLRLEKEFRELETQMIASIKELQRIATVKGIAEDQQVPAYDHKRFYEPPLHTPHSAQFMTVVQLFDRLISRAEGCWINHIMSAQTRKNIVRSWEKNLSQFVQDLHQIRLQAINQARKTGFGQRAAAIEAKVRREHADDRLEKTDLATTRKDNKPEPPSTQTQAPKQETVRAKASENEEAAPARQEVGSEVEEPARVEATA